LAASQWLSLEKHTYLLDSTYIFDLEMTVNGNASSHFLTSFSFSNWKHRSCRLAGFLSALLFIWLTCHFVVIAPGAPPPFLFFFFILLSPVHQGLSLSEAGVLGAPEL